MTAKLRSLLSGTKWARKIVSSSLSYGLFILLIAVTAPQAGYAKSLVLAAADSVPTAYVVDGKQVGILVDVVTEAFARAAIRWR